MRFDDVALAVSTALRDHNFEAIETEFGSVLIQPDIKDPGQIPLRVVYNPRTSMLEHPGRHVSPETLEFYEKYNGGRIYDLDLPQLMLKFVNEWLDKRKADSQPFRHQ